MKYIYLLISWFFSILFLLAAVGVALDGMALAALSFVAISLLLLPPLRKYVHSKNGVELGARSRGILIFFLFIATGMFMGVAEEAREKEEERLAQIKQEAQAQKVRDSRKEYFSENRGKIISKVEKHLDSESYDEAISEAGKYAFIGETELNELARTAREEKLNDQVDLTSDQNLSKLASLYEKLVSIRPDDKGYEEKLSQYQAKIAEQEKAEQEEKQREELIKSQFSAWDGSHYGLEKYIKRHMNDPDSYDHVETRYLDKGDRLLVITSFRGKNAFGGVVKNSIAAEVSLDGDVLKVISE